MSGKDAEEHALQTEASSLMYAAYARIGAVAEAPSEGVLEVRSGADVASEGVPRFRLVQRTFFQAAGEPAIEQTEDGARASGSMAARHFVDSLKHAHAGRLGDHARSL